MTNIHPAGLDMYAAYARDFIKVYGPEHCMTREQWDAACRKPRTARKLTDDEFDDDNFSRENGDGGIY